MNVTITLNGNDFSEKDFIVKKDNYNLKQDKALTYEELTEICRKQE